MIKESHEALEFSALVASRAFPSVGSSLLIGLTSPILGVESGLCKIDSGTRVPLHQHDLLHALQRTLAKELNDQGLYNGTSVGNEHVPNEGSMLDELEP